MPLRSRISPMKVKNGTASSVSFDMTAQMRCGAPGTASAEQAEFDSPRPKKMADRSAGERDRVAINKKMTSAANIRGANVVGEELDSWPKLPLLAELFGKLLLQARALVLFGRIGNQAEQIRDSLDELGESPAGRAARSDRNHEPCRPEGQAAALVEDFRCSCGIEDTGQDSHMIVIAIGKRKQLGAEHVDPSLGPFRRGAGDDVDAHVLVVEERVACANRNTAENKYHWISSHAFELRLNA